MAKGKKANEVSITTLNDPQGFNGRQFYVLEDRYMVQMPDNISALLANNNNGEFPSDYRIETSFYTGMVKGIVVANECTETDIVYREESGDNQLYRLKMKFGEEPQFMLQPDLGHIDVYLNYLSPTKIPTSEHDFLAAARRIIHSAMSDRLTTAQANRDQLNIEIPWLDKVLLRVNKEMYAFDKPMTDQS